MTRGSTNTSKAYCKGHINFTWLITCVFSIVFLIFTVSIKVRSAVLLQSLPPPYPSSHWSFVPLFCHNYGQNFPPPHIVLELQTKRARKRDPEKGKWTTFAAALFCNNFFTRISFDSTFTKWRLNALITIENDRTVHVQILVLLLHEIAGSEELIKLMSRFCADVIVVATTVVAVLGLVSVLGGCCRVVVQLLYSFASKKELRMQVS